MHPDEIITVEEIKKKISQKEDCCGRSGEHYQYMDIETFNNGMASYIVINTERWAIDDRDGWIKLWDDHIEPMQQLVNLEVDKKEKSS